MTGHLVFSTLHTNDAVETISTLRNMGVQPFLIASAVSAVIGQRLVRKICTKCKKPFPPNAELVKAIGLSANTKRLYRGTGCAECHLTGNSGRTGIFELLDITQNIRTLIVQGAGSDEIIAAAGLKTMADRCRSKIKAGIVSPEEYLKVIRI
jgi:type IV pilus assembly protein PilB